MTIEETLWVATSTRVDVVAIVVAAAIASETALIVPIVFGKGVRTTPRCP